MKVSQGLVMASHNKALSSFGDPMELLGDWMPLLLVPLLPSFQCVDALV